MNAADLRAFTTRSQMIWETEPPSSLRETRTWLVEPLLETLGWSVHAADRDLEIDGVTIEYVCSIDDVPALLVAVQPASESLTESIETTLTAAMRASGVDRAIHTNGRQLVLRAEPDGSQRFSCSISALPDHASALEQVSQSSIKQRLEQESDTQTARQLAVRRRQIVTDITACLVDAAGSTQEAKFERAADVFVGNLIDALTAAADDGSTATSDSTASTDETPADPSDEQTAATPSEQQPPPASPASSEDGEFIVRFFNDRGSVGAIGHSTPAGALVEAAEYLFERGLSGIRTPWQTASETVINDEPVCADGTPMDAAQQLSNGYYLNTAGTAETCANRAVAMTERAGLRAMLSGDWAE